MNFDFDLITLLSVDTDLKEHLPAVFSSRKCLDFNIIVLSLLFNK